MSEKEFEQAAKNPPDTTKNLRGTIPNPDSTEWRGYEEVCRQCGLPSPNADYSFSLHEEYRRCNNSFTLNDFQELAQFRPTIAMVSACSRSFPYLRVGDLRVLHKAQVTPEKILSLRACLEQTFSSGNAPLMRSEHIVALQDIPLKNIQGYFHSYRTHEYIRQGLPFDTIIEVCSFKIPVSFLEECVQNNSPGFSLFSETIRSLHDIGPSAPKAWGKYTQKEQQLEHWSSSDYVALIRAQPDDGTYNRIYTYARDTTLQLSAPQCIKLAQSEKSSLQSLHIYRDFLSIPRDTTNQSRIIPNKDDVVECALSLIPTNTITQYREQEKKINSGYYPDTWSVSHIITMYRSGVSPDQTVHIWDRFSGDGQWNRFDCKREIRAELLAMPGFIALTDFLLQSKETLRIGKKSLELKNSDSSIGFIRWILKTIEWNGKGIPTRPEEWKNVIRQYEENLNEFIQEGDNQEFAQIFFISAQGDEDKEKAFQGVETFRETLEKRYGKKVVRDYSNGWTYGEPSMRRVERFIEAIEKYTQDPETKNKPILIHLGFHGSGNGVTGPFSQEQMARLAHIASKPMIVLDIMSCYGGKKMDATTQNLANVRLSSEFHAGRISYGELINAFRPKRTLSPESIKTLDTQYEGKISLLHDIDFRGKKLLSTSVHDKRILPAIGYNKEDLAEIMKIKTPSGNTVEQDPILARLLENLLSESRGTYEADFNGNGTVSYAEAILYRSIHHRANLLPTNFITENGSHKVI